MKYPVYQPFLGPKEKEWVIDCIDSTWISSRGKYVNQFEDALAEYAKVPHAIAMHNGTHPLHIACILAGVGPGTEVILPTFSYVATGNVVQYCGAKPVFVDCNADDWNINLSQVEQAITPRTKAIIAVDVYGYPADYDGLRQLIGDRNITLIADAAESIGATYKGRPTGSLADLSTFSFFGNKTITTGEGGALLCHNDQWAQQARQLKNQGNSKTVRYFHDLLGYNYRMTNIQAAIGLAQMERINDIVKRKQQLFHRYKAHLEQWVTFQPVQEDRQSSYWLVSFLLPEGTNRDRLTDYLNEKGVDTRPFFTPMDQLPYFEDGHFPVAHRSALRGLSVPSYPQLSDKDIDTIAEQIIEGLKKNR